MLYIFWGLSCLVANYVAAKFATIRAMSIQDHPLPDLLHDVFPKIPNHVPDYLLILCLSYIMILNLPINNVEIFRFLFSLSLRPIFICLTTFPTCYQEDNSPYSWSKHDLMFSGHTCCFLFFGRVIQGALGISIQYVFPFTLIAARQHYTIDVIVAMLVYSNI